MTTRLAFIVTMLSLFASAAAPLPAFARSDERMKKVCDSVRREAVPCYAHMAPMYLVMVSISVTQRLKQGIDPQGVDDAARADMEEHLRYARLKAADQPKKLEQLELAHKVVLATYKNALPKKGESEEARQARVATLRTELVKALEPLEAAK